MRHHAGGTAGDLDGGASCPWKLDRYEPSDWEKEWVEGGEDLQNIVCQVRALQWSVSPVTTKDSCMLLAVPHT